MSSEESLALFLVTFYATYFCFIAIISIITIIGNWFIFKKAGHEGWKAIIPFYNSWILSEISLGKGYYMFFTFIPVIGIVFAYYWLYKICASFGKGIGFTLGYIFLNPVFHLILAFDKSRYIGASPNFWES